MMGAHVVEQNVSKKHDAAFIDATWSARFSTSVGRVASGSSARVGWEPKVAFTAR